MTTPKIVGISRVMRLFCLVLFLATPFAVALVWWKIEFFLPQMPGMGGLSIHPERIGPGTRLLGFVVHMIPAAVAMYGFQELRRLFELYANGEIFSLGCVKHLKNFARALLVYAVASPAAMAAISMVITMNNPPGERALSITISSNDLVTLFVGGVFVAIARVMAEGHRLAEDNAAIV